MSKNMKVLLLISAALLALIGGAVFCYGIYLMFGWGVYVALGGMALWTIGTKIMEAVSKQRIFPVTNLEINAKMGTNGKS